MEQKVLSFQRKVTWASLSRTYWAEMKNEKLSAFKENLPESVSVEGKQRCLKASVYDIKKETSLGVRGNLPEPLSRRDREVHKQGAGFKGNSPVPLSIKRKEKCFEGIWHKTRRVLRFQMKSAHSYCMHVLPGMPPFRATQFLSPTLTRRHSSGAWCPPFLWLPPSSCTCQSKSFLSFISGTCGSDMAGG